MYDKSGTCIVLLAVILFHATLVQAISKNLLKVNTVDRDGNMVVESVVYSSDMTLAGLRAAADPDSPIKWSAFCKSRTAGFNLPFYSFDKEVSDLELVTSHYSADDEVEASYVFVKMDQKDFFAMPICPYSTFSQLRDRIAMRIGNPHFTFEVDNLDEERTSVRKFVRTSSLKGILPGSSLIGRYESLGKVRERTVFITTGGIGIQKSKGPHETIYDLMNKRINPEAEAEAAKIPYEMPVVVTLNDESVIILPKVDLKSTTVGVLRDIIKNKLTDRQKELGYHQTSAICSPRTQVELNDDDLLSKHVSVKDEAVMFNVSFMSIVDWPSGSPEKQVVTVCPKSTIKQVITRATKSYKRVQVVAQYAVLGNHLLTSTVPSKYVKEYLSQAADSKPLHIRFVDSIFVNVQDGEGHRLVMVQDFNHRYKVAKVYESFTNLLGVQHAYSMVICGSYNRLGDIELPSTASLADHNLAYDGVQLNAMVIRVKITLESKRETVELLMNVCAKSTQADLETRIRLAVAADDNDNLYFLTERAGKILPKDDIDLSWYRTRPPVFPSRTLYVWLGREPFFVKDRTKVADGYVDGINIIYTLPDETVQLFNNVDPNMPIAGLRDEIRKRLTGENLQNNAHLTLALCTRFHQPFQEGKTVGKYLSVRDNYLGIHWVTLRDWSYHGGDKLVVVTVCAGETYADLINRAAPSRKDIGDAKNYQVMDGSFVDSVISRKYLADECGLNAAKTLEIRPRDERIVQVQGSDGKYTSVSVPLNAKISDLRAKLAKVIGTAPAWGVGFCKPGGITTTVLREHGEVDEKEFVGRVYGASDGVKVKAGGSQIILLKFKGNVMRIPVTVCNGSDYTDLKKRMKKAVGAGDDDIVILAEDKKSLLSKYLSIFGRSSKVLHMEIIIKDKSGKSTDGSDSSESSSTGDKDSLDRHVSASSTTSLNNPPFITSKLISMGFQAILVVVIIVLIILHQQSIRSEPNKQEHDSTVPIDEAPMPEQLDSTPLANMESADKPADSSPSFDEASSDDKSSAQFDQLK